MTKKNIKQSSNLAGLTIAPACRITKMVIDYTTDKAKLVTVAECFYTPRHIANELRKLNITSSTWVIGPTGKELWKLDGELAKKL